MPKKKTGVILRPFMGVYGVTESYRAELARLK